MNKDNKVFKLVMEKKIFEHLTWMFFNLSSVDLNAILQIEVLNSDHLLATLNWLKSDDLKDILINSTNGVSECLKECPNYLACVFYRFNSCDLNALLNNSNILDFRL
jgi:hypothetical protein